MFFKEYFTFKQLQRKLKGLEPKKECAYIIDGFALLGKLRQIHLSEPLLFPHL